MKNEIGRKITSLTLMTIMVAGGMSFAIPGVMPVAYAANANLFVSAENSQFSNYMSGPQVIEVVIIDPDIDDTDEAKGEPDVTVNGKIIRMVQAVDGNWYGYFADVVQAQIADSSTSAAGVGLDFGGFCDNAIAVDLGLGTSVVTFTDTVGIALSDPDDTTGEIQGSPTGAPIPPGTCTAITPDGNNTPDNQNVLREEKDINLTVPAGGNGFGQIGIDDDFWPVIQLYPLSVGGNVIIQYNKGGGAQTTTLTFDTVEGFAGIELDRSIYPRSAQVHVTITDLWLNIDPTDEDSWSFDTAGFGTDGLDTLYQVFDENGNEAGSGTAPASFDINEGSFLSDLMLEDNGILIVNINTQSASEAVLTVQDTDDNAYEETGTSTVATDTQDALIVESTAGGGTTLPAGSVPVTIVELGPNSGIFGTYDESDNSNIVIRDNALRGTSGTVDYNETPTTVLVGFDFASIDIQPLDDEWSSGEEIPVVLVDGDANKNSRADEDLDLNDPLVSIIPALQTGSPFTLGNNDGSQSALYLDDVGTLFANSDIIGTDTDLSTIAGYGTGTNIPTFSFEIQTFSQRGIINVTSSSFTGAQTIEGILIDLTSNIETVTATYVDTRGTTTEGFNLFNIDVRSIDGVNTVDAYIVNGTLATGAAGGASAGDNFVIKIAENVNVQSLTDMTSDTISEILHDEQTANTEINLLLVFNAVIDPDPITDAQNPIVTDFFSFGFTDDGVQSSERISNQIIRLELEETGDNTSTFEGSLEYIMVNQLNIAVQGTYDTLSPIADDPNFIVIEDLTDEDSPRVNYNDLGEDGTILPVADQEEAPSHSGVVSFDLSTYKIADTVVITLQDADLNVDSDLIDIFTVVSTVGDAAFDSIGLAGLPTGFGFGDLGRMVDVTFDDIQWITPLALTCTSDGTTSGTDFLNDAFNTGLGQTGFTLVETGTDSGIFVGDFAISNIWCRAAGTTGDPNQYETVTGLDLEVNYVDFRDASGEIIEVGDSAGVRANTGSISLDRTVYPVPFGEIGDFATESTQSTPNDRSIFPIHATGISGALDDAAETLGGGDLILHIRVNDPDFDISPDGEDVIGRDKAGSTIGPVRITILRGADVVVIGYAGGNTAQNGRIDVGNNNAENTRDFGPIVEIAPDAGIFEIDVAIRYTDGPDSALCPITTTFTALGDGSNSTETGRFDTPATGSNNYCILQGDILQVEYTDPEDASGDVNTVTDSATFDLRNGVLQSDKSVYIIGSDMILTLIEPDFDLDNDGAETYDLDLIEWDSDAATITMGNAGLNAANFDPEPTDFRETGDSTGIFQIVIEIPEVLAQAGAADRLERGEEIILEYTDWGPSGSDFVGDEDEDINLTIFTSNFGATVELDQKVYTWTDKIYITIVAPDHNFDSDLVDEIGETGLDPVKVSTRGFNLKQYKLVETGTDTGIFTGEVILTGFAHDADGDSTTGRPPLGTDTNPRTQPRTEGGPTDGFLQTDDDDGITVSFEFSEDETVVGSALIRWNIGETQWLEASYPASGTGVVRIVDPDMNLDPEAVDNFDVDVWSDSDAGGIDLTVTETNEATGIFEGTVFFTTTDESSGHRLRVSEGDTITAEYEDNTLPDPYTTADELDITGTSLIGTIVPPLERAPAANARVVDAFGNSLASVSIDQQVQIAADLANGQDREQSFAYLVQVQDGNGVTIALAWISGTLAAGQSFSPALSWTPDASGTYTATVFVWESVDNPTALSPPTSVDISVS